MNQKGAVTRVNDVITVTGSICLRDRSLAARHVRGSFALPGVREALNKLVFCVVRQAHHERNQLLAVRPEPVEGLVQCLLRYSAFTGLLHERRAG